MGAKRSVGASVAFSIWRLVEVIRTCGRGHAQFSFSHGCATIENILINTCSWAKESADWTTQQQGAALFEGLLLAFSRCSERSRCSRMGKFLCEADLRWLPGLTRELCRLFITGTGRDAAQRGLSGRTCGGRGGELTILELLAAYWRAFVASNRALLRRLRPALCGVPLFGTMGAQIEVCQAGSCRAAGSEAVLREIEELAKDYPCSVRPSGCVGACSQAPNAVTVEPDGSETLHTRLVTVDKSVAVVEAATGKAPNIEDPAMWERLGAARRMRMRRLAKEEKRWNAAMSGMNEQIAKTTDLDDRMELETELCELLVSAGRWELAAELLTQIKATTDAMDSPDPQIILSLAEVLGKLKRVDAIEVLQEEVWRVFAGQRFARLREQVSARLMKHKIEAGEAKPAHRIDGYSQWTLKTVTPKSGHSALFQFESKDMKRGTPFPRGRQVLSALKPTLGGHESVMRTVR